MAKRVRLDAKATPKSKSAILAPGRSTLFGEPLLLEGEDAAAYDELLARVYAAVKPADIIDEMLIADVVALEWEVLRWRRVNLGLIRARILKELKCFLNENLDFNLYRDDFIEDLTETLQDNVPQGEKNFAQTLAHQCAENQPQAVDKVKEILAAMDLDFDQFLEDVRAEKVEELMQGYARRTPGAVTRINEILADAGTSMDSLVADALSGRFDYIERIDHLTHIAENRRDAGLREIDRRRAVLSETVRHSLREIEDGELKMIEAPAAEGKNAA
jgi:hypothetical protein